jgi:hypothetical protein
MIVTTLAALGLLIRNNLIATGGNVVLGITATLLLVFSVGVVAVGTARFAQALSVPPRPMPATATGE